MSTLLLIRHGQASFGEANYDRLSAAGEAQAIATGTHLVYRGQAFDGAYTGPRERHRGTAALILQNAGVPEVDMALDEFTDGTSLLKAAERRTGVHVASDGTLPRRERLRHYIDELHLWAKGSSQPEGTPSLQDFRGVVACWLKDLGARSAPGARILATTSAGFIAATVCNVMGLMNSEFVNVMSLTDNCSITEVLFSQGRASVRCFNSTAHLPLDLVTAM